MKDPRYKWYTLSVDPDIKVKFDPINEFLTINDTSTFYPVDSYSPWNATEIVGQYPYKAAIQASLTHDFNIDDSEIDRVMGKLLELAVEFESVYALYNRDSRNGVN